MSRASPKNDFDDEDIRVLAYRMWEDEGRPEGRAEEFWFRALDQLSGREDAQGVETENRGQLREGSKI